MRPTHNVIWVVPPADADLVSAVHACDGSDEALARVAKELIRARPVVAADLSAFAELHPAEPRAVLEAALAAAQVEAEAIVAEGRAEAAAVGLELSSVSSGRAEHEALRVLNQAQGVRSPDGRGLLVQLIEWDPAVLALADRVPVEVLPTANLEAIRSDRLARVPVVVEEVLAGRGFTHAGVPHGLAPDERTYWLAAATAELTYPQPPIVGLDGSVVVFESEVELRAAAREAIARVQAIRAAAAWTGAAIAQAASPAEMDAALSALASA